MGILYLVKVGETQRMGEFVAECADAGDIVGETAQLVGACIVAQSHAVVHYTAAYLSRMWPHACLVAGVGLAEAGIKEIYVVDNAIVVSIIYAKIHLVVDKVAGIPD